MSCHSVLTCLAAVGLWGCAEPKLIAPPAPAQPLIGGAVSSVSASDIRIVLAMMRADIATRLKSPAPIYAVQVDDHNHIEILYYPEGTKTVAEADRINGKWRLSEIERLVLGGSNFAKKRW